MTPVPGLRLVDRWWGGPVTVNWAARHKTWLSGSRSRRPGAPCRACSRRSAHADGEFGERCVGKIELKPGHGQVGLRVAQGAGRRLQLRQRPGTGRRRRHHRPLNHTPGTPWARPGPANCPAPRCARVTIARQSARRCRGRRPAPDPARTRRGNPSRTGREHTS